MTTPPTPPPDHSRVWLALMKADAQDLAREVLDALAWPLADAPTAPEPAPAAPSAVQDPAAGTSGPPNRPEGHTEALVERIATIIATWDDGSTVADSAQWDTPAAWRGEAGAVLDLLAAEDRLCEPGVVQRLSALLAEACDRRDRLRDRLAAAQAVMGAHITTGSLPPGSDRYTTGCVAHGEHSSPKCRTCGATACCVHCLPLSVRRPELAP